VPDPEAVPNPQAVPDPEAAPNPQAASDPHAVPDPQAAPDPLTVPDPQTSNFSEIFEPSTLTLLLPDVMHDEPFVPRRLKIFATRCISGGETS